MNRCVPLEIENYFLISYIKNKPRVIWNID